MLTKEEIINKYWTPSGDPFEITLNRNSFRRLDIMGFINGRFISLQKYKNENLIKRLKQHGKTGI